MIKNIFRLLLILPLIGFAQEKPISYTINYTNISNGKKSDKIRSITYQDAIVYLSKPEDKNQQFINFKTREVIKTIENGDALFKQVRSFDSLPKPVFENKPETILGYTCKYAKYSYFSNTVEVWFTEETKAKGSPNTSFLPSENALVLKIVSNGSRAVLVNSIDEIKTAEPRIYSADKAKQVTAAEFEELKINSRFTEVSIFDNEIINFDTNLKTPDANQIAANTTYHFSKGSVIAKKIKLTPELKQSGYVFAKLLCRSNGDAYDRTGSVFIIPVDENNSVMNAYLNGLNQLPVYVDNSGKEYQGIKKDGNYNPPIEIMRFFTSFGANHFNDKRVINNYDWAENVRYKQEVTSLIPTDVDEIWVGVFVGNYDKSGHKVSLDLGFYPSFEEDKKKSSKYIEPLFSTVNTLEMSGQNYGQLFKTDTLKVDFETPKNTKNLQLIYTSTGHGGWGNGDEFVPKLNKVFIDGKPVFNIVPWRTDCATYRFSNPASGNFGNGLSSSDFSRSNWCPGTLTPPYLIPLDGLSPGKHTIEVVIDQGENEGNSFSHWSVTGVLVGDVNASEENK